MICPLWRLEHENNRLRRAVSSSRFYSCASIVRLMRLLAAMMRLRAHG